MRPESPLVGVLLVMLVILGVLVPRSSVAQEATPANCPETTPEENARLVTEMHAAVAAGEDVTSYLADAHTAKAADQGDPRASSTTRALC